MFAKEGYFTIFVVLLFTALADIFAFYSESILHQIEAGDRFGIMEFDSRMDILVPSNVPIYVKEGDKTVAGETIIGKIHSL